MASMRWIEFTGPRELRLAEGPVPVPGPGEIVVETTVSLISTGTESTCYTRNFAPGTHWDNWVKYPFRTGYLNVGRVSAVGEGVEGWEVGTRVVSRSHHASHVVLPVGAGRASDPSQGDCTPGVSAVPVPEGVSDDAAVWMGLGKITQVGVRSAEPAMGDDVVIVGLGLLGQLVVQYSRLMGARTIIAIDTAPLRLEMALAHGATDALALSAGDARDEVWARTGGKGADIVYDITGHPAVLAAALPLARKFGKFVLLGDPGDPGSQHLTPDVITRGVRIIGAHDLHAPVTQFAPETWTDARITRLFLEYVRRGEMRTAELITHRFRPEQAKEVFDLLQTPARQEVMGVAFDW